MTQVFLGSMVGFDTPQQISRIEKFHVKSLSLFARRRLAEIFHIPPDALDDPDLVERMERLDSLDKEGGKNYAFDTCITPEVPGFPCTAHIPILKSVPTLDDLQDLRRLAVFTFDLPTVAPHTFEGCFAYAVMEMDMVPILNLGDIIIIDPERKSSIRNGEMVVARCGSDVLLRVYRVYQQPHAIQLVPRNSRFRPIEIPNPKIDIIGVIVRIVGLAPLLESL